ncbi:DoxX family protein [Wenzhouxiangella limi]|uniref:DoxX family protein n=1 Tax=Wenzhouxiangella limi TaxID=2707351 RepID=A0A845UX85_9GAMM|nr:DoxX family protein [Wenzhouxiangella limi]NDY96473.1 DoxX family protein [Wenzhouxiangella limi]
MIVNFYDALTRRLRASGDWVAPLGLRLLLAYEFWTAGYGKFKVGTEAPTWFANQDFVFPFGLLSANMNWVMVTWGEMLAALAVLLGLFTRFFAFSLLVITVVAIAAMHWPASWDSLGQLWEGYSVSRVMDDGEFRGNFRIPFLFLAMILPLVFWGAGKLSLDHLLVSLSGRQGQFLEREPDRVAFGLATLIFGLMAIFLIPAWGIVLLLLSAGLLGYTGYGWYAAQRA